jgi:hypothetical protein
MPETLSNATKRPNLLTVYIRIKKIVNKFRTLNDTGKVSTDRYKETDAALSNGDVRSVQPKLFSV